MVFFAVGLGVTSSVCMVRHTTTLRENLPASPMRAAVLGLVRAEPGIMFSELRERLQCSAGTIQHHVNLLERERFLISVQSGRRRRLFLAGTSLETRSGVDLLRSGRTWQLIQSVLEHPGIVQKDITDGLDISRKVLRGYLDRLAEQGLVREVAVGRFRSYYPSDELFSLIERMRSAEAPEGEPAAPAQAGLDAPKPQAGSDAPRPPPRPSLGA